MSSEGRDPEQKPLACDRGALDPKQRLRHEGLWKRVDELSTGPEATAQGGVAFILPRDQELARELGELAALEQICCPFLRVTVTLEPDEGPLVLELSGSGDVGDFLAREMPLS